MPRDVSPIDVAVLSTLGLLAFGLASSVSLYLSLGYPITAIRPWSALELLPYAASIGAQPLLRATAVGALCGAAIAFLPVVTRRQAPHGAARFARAGELRHQRLRDREGLVLGLAAGRFICNDEPLHALVCAPTRSGKGVGLVIPNLFAWPGSLLVLDVKGENYDITSGFRATVSRVYRFSPMSTRTHRYNPLDAVRADIAHRLSDLQQLAAILVPAPDRSGRTTMWEDEARDLFVGLALYVLDTSGIPHTIGEVYRILKTDNDLGEVFALWLKERSDLDPACVQALGNFRHKAPKERSGVKSSLTSALILWSNPVIDAATSASDFTFGELRRHRRSLYVAVTLGELPVVKRLLSLFFQQALAVLTRELPTPEERYRVLFVMDEFASLGRMEVLADMLPFMAGFGVRMMTIVQGLGQLDDLYGQGGASNIVQNSALQVFFAANDEVTARYISSRLGTKTIKAASRSFSLGRVPSQSVSDQRRELMLPQEVRALRAHQLILFKEGLLPVLARKIRYYDDRAFKPRLLPAAAAPELEVVRIPPRVFAVDTSSASSAELDAAPIRARGARLSRRLQEMSDRLHDAPVV